MMGGRLQNCFELTATVRLPRGEQAIWDRMLLVNEASGGRWSLTDIYAGSGEHLATIRQYLRRLIAAGMAVQVDQAAPAIPGTEGAKFYRLAVTPVDAPRFDAGGQLLGERASDTIWRAAKMLGQFTAATLTGEADAGLTVATVERYLRAWERAGILSASRTAGHPVSYRVVRNIGRYGPRIMRGSLVFDPNGREIVGPADMAEVRS